MSSECHAEGPDGFRRDAAGREYVVGPTGRRLYRGKTTFPAGLLKHLAAEFAAGKNLVRLPGPREDSPRE